MFAIDRAGLVGEDGATHMGNFDLSFLRIIPNIALCAPRDGEDLKLLLRLALTKNLPIAIRYPKCSAPKIGPIENRNIEGADILLKGDDAYIIGIGPILQYCLETAQKLNTLGFSVGVIDARWIKPLDTKLFKNIHTPFLFTVEENTLEGGFGSAILEFYSDNTDNLTQLPKIIRIGVTNPFCEHATRNEQLYMFGLTSQKLTMKIITILTNVKIEAHTPQEQVYFTSCKKNQIYDNLIIPDD